MKRAADGVHQQPPRRPPQTQDVQTPPGRERAQGGALISLAEPIPGKDGQSLAEVLQGTLKDMQGDEAMVSTVRASVDAILALDATDQVGAVDDNTCRTAVNLLLSLGQATLLCRLVAMTKTPCAFDLGAHPQNDQVLARIGASWPQDVPVSIRMSTSQSFELVTGLQAFLRQPQALSVHLVDDGFQLGPVAGAPVSQVLRLRSLLALTIEVKVGPGGEIALDVIQALPGVVAQSIKLMFGASYKRNPDIEAALVQFVRHAGAKALDVSDWSVPPALATQLLDCRSEWDCVHLLMGEETEAWLGEGAHKIGQLEMSWPIGHEPDPAREGSVQHQFELLCLLEQHGVHTWVRHAMEDLCVFAAALKMFGQHSKHVFERIEACFMANGIDSAIEAALVMLSRSLNAVTIAHQTTGVSTSVSGHPLQGDVVARLNGISALNRLTPATERMEQQQRAMDAQQKETARTLAGLLAADRPDQDLIDYLKSPENRACPPVDVSAIPAVLQSNGLQKKVCALVLAPVDADLLRAAVVVWARTAQQDEIAQMAHVLVHLGFPRKVRPEAEWQAMGQAFHQTWMHEGLPRDTVADVTPLPPPDPNAQRIEALPSEPLATGVVAAQPAVVNLDRLVRPQGQASRLSVLDSLAQRLADPRIRNPRRREALNLIVGFLQTGRIDPVRAAALANEIAHELHGLEQLVVVKHIARLAPTRWPLLVRSRQDAAALRELEGWPDDPQCFCGVSISTALPSAAMADVAAFVRLVKPHRLTVHLEIRQDATPATLDVLAELIRASAGLALEMTQSRETLFFPVEAMSGLLNKVQGTPIRKVALAGIDVGDGAFVQAVVDLLTASHVKALDINGCSAVLTQMALQCQPWAELEVRADASVAHAFAGGTVAAEQLKVIVARHYKEDRDWVESIGVGCKGLRSVEIIYEPVNVLSMAKALDRNPTLVSIKCCFSMASAEEVEEALRILGRNTSLLYFEQTQEAFLKGGQLPLEEGHLKAIRDLITRNRLRHPELAGEGAGKGWGWSLGDGRALIDIGSPLFQANTRPFVDAGGLVGRYLDSQSVVALASTSKAAYVGSRSAWETEIDRLAGLFDIQEYGEFKEKLVNQLTHLSRPYPALSGKAPSRAAAPDTVLDKVFDMLAAGVPRSAVAQALGRRLHWQRGSAGEVVEALAYIGAVPPLQWLQEGLGIDPQAIPA